MRPRFWIVVVMSLAQCTRPSTTTTTLPVTRLRADPMAFVYQSGYDQPTTFAIRSAQELASAWAIIYRGVSPVPPPPSVDFATEMIVGVAIGTQPNSGVDIVISGANVWAGTIT